MDVIKVPEQRVVIVGAGVLGLFTALELVRAGKVAVTVIDASHPGNASSGRSVGMVETQYPTRPEIEVRVFGLQAYSALEQDYGLTFVHGGYLRLGHSEQDVDRFVDSVRIQAELGVEDTLILSGRDMALRWPQLNTDGLVVGVLGQSDGYVDGYEVCQLLSRLVRQGRGSVRSGSPLLAADRGADGAWVLNVAGAPMEADVVVNAAGPWAGVVGDLLGAPVELLPQLSGALTVQLGSLIPQMPFVMDYVPGSGTDGVYFRSERPDQLIAGIHTDDATAAPVSPDISLGAMPMDAIERIVELLSDRLRGVDDMRVGRSWTGIYPTSRDYHPIVGVHSTAPGVICALGAGGAGIQLAPAIGRLAADAVLGRSGSTMGAGMDWSQGR